MTYKYLFLSLCISVSLLSSCGANDEQQPQNADSSSQATEATVDHAPSQPADTATYANERFRNVRVKKVDHNTYRLTGQAQVFEAAFSWSVEDGHNVLKEGHEMTNHGAPEWGDFSFTVTAEKRRSNSTLLIILFEASAKDGSRQHELPVPLL